MQEMLEHVAWRTESIGRKLRLWSILAVLLLISATPAPRLVCLCCC
jgi:hypothetical protein